MTIAKQKLQVNLERSYVIYDRQRRRWLAVTGDGQTKGEWYDCAIGSRAARLAALKVDSPVLHQVLLDLVTGGHGYDPDRLIKAAFALRDGDELPSGDDVEVFLDRVRLLKPICDMTVSTKKIGGYNVTTTGNDPVEWLQLAWGELVDLKGKGIMLQDLWPLIEQADLYLIEPGGIEVQQLRVVYRFKRGRANESDH